MGKYEVSVADSVLSEGERAQLETGLTILASILARTYIREKACIDRKKLGHQRLSLTLPL